MLVARLNDICSGTCRYHGQQTGKIIESSSDVTVNGVGVARVGDKVQANCGHFGTIVDNGLNVYANNKSIARINDTTEGDFTATITTSSSDVNAG